MRILVNRPTDGEGFGDGLLDAMFRLRARYFNGMRGWNLPLESGCEIDRFDGTGTLYAAALEDDGTMVGCFRLLPTDRPHLLDSCFPDLMAAASGRSLMHGPGLWEISRLAVIPTEPDSPFRTETVRITAALLDGLFAICEARKNPYFNMVEPDETGALKLSKTLPGTVVRRQDAPPVYEHVASIYIMTPEYVRRASYLLDGHMEGYDIGPEKSFDVDSELDFAIIEFLMKRKLGIAE